MNALNRYQIVAACALVVCILGIVHAVSVFLTDPGFDSLEDESLSTVNRSVSLSLPGNESFPPIGDTVSRNPFAAPSRWRSPKPGELPPPPFEDLLKLTPSPVLLRSDGLPRLGRLPGEEDSRLDNTLITKLKRLFRDRTRSAQQ